MTINDMNIAKHLFFVSQIALWGFREKYVPTTAQYWHWLPRIVVHLYWRLPRIIAISVNSRCFVMQSRDIQGGKV